MKKEEYGEVMRFLFGFRDQYQTEEEYRQFLCQAMRELVHDLREFEVFITLQPASLSRQHNLARAASTSDSI